MIVRNEKLANGKSITVLGSVYCFVDTVLAQPILHIHRYRYELQHKRIQDSSITVCCDKVQARNGEYEAWNETRDARRFMLNSNAV